MSNKNNFAPKVGDVIAVALNEPSGGACCYVGWIDAIDERGILVNQVDWFIGDTSGKRYFIPWNNVHSYFSCEKGNEEYFFDRRAQQFQTLHTDFLLKKWNIKEEELAELRKKAWG
jgi:hypothetical protein